MPMYEGCHKNCRETRAHSVCALPPHLRVRAMEQMLSRVEHLRETKQGQRILSEYAGVEVKLQEAVE